MDFSKNRFPPGDTLFAWNGYMSDNNGNTWAIKDPRRSLIDPGPSPFSLPPSYIPLRKLPNLGEHGKSLQIFDVVFPNFYLCDPTQIPTDFLFFLCREIFIFVIYFYKLDEIDLVGIKKYH